MATITPQLQINPNPNYGENLWDDFADLLEGDLAFKGQPYYSSHQTLAPNPGIDIDGLGPIGLPLSSREARTLHGYASAYPQKSHTAGGDSIYYEIPGERINISAEDWKSFIENSVTAACKHLGLQPWDYPITCNLRNMLVIQGGSRMILPYRSSTDSQNNRMFASFLVFLPSTTAGGQIRLKNESLRKDVDLGPKPFQTSVLAYFTDTKPHYIPSTTGDQVVLSYDLVHGAAKVSPQLPTENSISVKLGYVLKRWRDMQYNKRPSGNRLVIPLERTRSIESERHVTREFFDSKDRQVYTPMKEALNSLGLVAFLGQLEYIDLKGKVRISMRYLRTVNGDHVLKDSELALSEDSLLPKNPFLNARPQWTRCNEANKNIEQGFSRTAILVVNKDEEFSILRLADVDYSVSNLRGRLNDQHHTTWTPTIIDRTMAELAILRIHDTNTEQRSVIMEVCFKWNDRNLWRRFIEKSGKSIGFFGTDSLVKAAKGFTFSSVKPIFNKMMIASKSLKDRVDLIQALTEWTWPVDDETLAEKDAWCNTQSKGIINSLKSPQTKQIPELVRIAESRCEDTMFLNKELLGYLHKGPPSFELLHSIIKALFQSESLSATPEGKNFTLKCVDAFLKQPNNTIYSCESGSGVDQERRAKDVLEICLLAGKFEECQTPLCVLLHSVDQSTWELVNLAEFIHKLQKGGMLKRTGDVKPPFPTFLRAIIGWYFAINFSKPEPAEKIPVFGYGCEKSACNCCENLRAYLFDIKRQDERSLHITAPERKHLEPYLAQCRKLVRYQVHYQPFRIILYKTAELEKAQKWEDKVTQAKSFLEKIGHESTIKTLMGDQYEDVRKALDGSRPFSSTNDFKLALGRLGDDFEISDSNTAEACSKDTEMADERSCATSDPESDSEPLQRKVKANSLKRTSIESAISTIQKKRRKSEKIDARAIFAYGHC